MKPLFEVGERVILQSKDCPEYNGEYIIHSQYEHGGIYHDRLAGEDVEISIRPDRPPFSYLLSEIMPSTQHYGYESLWNQGALRKKHKPSELSFNEMINTFKITEKM